jgi:cell division protein FtsI (penicillin-binding protein 3)
VVDEGTGSKARLTSWSSAGKTGTSEKVDPQTRRYSDHLRIASFIGFAPSVDPHLVIYVVVDEPFVKPYTGGIHAAPIFNEIAEEALRYLNVAPDKFPAKDVLAKGTNDHLQKSERAIKPFKESGTPWSKILWGTWVGVQNVNPFLLISPTV